MELRMLMAGWANDLYLICWLSLSSKKLACAGWTVCEVVSLFLEGVILKWIRKWGLLEGFQVYTFIFLLTQLFLFRNMKDTYFWLSISLFPFQCYLLMESFCLILILYLLFLLLSLISLLQSFDLQLVIVKYQHSKIFFSSFFLSFFLINFSYEQLKTYLIDFLCQSDQENFFFLK